MVSSDLWCLVIILWVIQIADLLELILYFPLPRSLLENSHFQESVRNVEDEPIPYFSQFRSAKSAELQDSRQDSTIPSRASASTDLDLEKDGEMRKMSQETSLSDFLEFWKIFHHEQLREKEIISR